MLGIIRQMVAGCSEFPDKARKITETSGNTESSQPRYHQLEKKVLRVLWRSCYSLSLGL